MTLGDLAAMAATVEGFVRPTVECSGCDGSGGVFVWYGETRETAYGSRCEQCGNTGRVFDNSPAALAMAVLVYLRWCRGDYEVVGPLLSVSVYHVAGAAPFKRGCAVIKGDIPNYVAHAYLTALLRAHGVEVPNENHDDDTGLHALPMGGDAQRSHRRVARSALTADSRRDELRAPGGNVSAQG